MNHLAVLSDELEAVNIPMGRCYTAPRRYCGMRMRWDAPKMAESIDMINSTKSDLSRGYICANTSFSL